MNLTDIRELLELHGVTPSKSLGQNFLIDANIARAIVGLLDIQPGDCVVEVGPGTGALTEHLVGLGRKTILVEFDSRLAAYHQERWEGRDDVEVHHADAAQWDVRPLFKEAPVKLLGNLPYSAGGAILANFLGNPSPISKAVIMLQKEFIDRILATPESDAYGLLSLRMQMHWVPKASKTVPPEAFFPRPKIDSTVMTLTPRAADEFPPFSDKLMDELMRRAFAQRRKQMKKQMPSVPAWEEVVAQLGISPSARAEELDLGRWIALTRLYDTHPLADVAQDNEEVFDVVDEANQVVRTETRGRIHAEGLNHRSAHCFLFTKKGELVLQKRSAFKDRCPSLWDSSAAGHLDAGEDYEEAVRRELAEELGATEVEDLEFCASFPASEMNGHEFVHLYTARLKGKVGKLNYPAAEISAILPLSLEELGAWVERRPEDFAPGFLQCWRTFLENPSLYQRY